MDTGASGNLGLEFRIKLLVVPLLMLVGNEGNKGNKKRMGTTLSPRVVLGLL